MAPWELIGTKGRELQAEGTVGTDPEFEMPDRLKEHARAMWPHHRWREVSSRR